MEALVFDKPYEFVPPYEGRFWPAALQKLVRWYLRWSYGITEVECHGLERLRQAHAAGQSILLAPNHCRPCDPFVVSELTRRAGTLPYMIGSWHLFMQGRFQAWMLRHAGVFSIYREGVDRAAINAGIEILSAAKHPLVLFPEGVVSRANDRLNPLMEGMALIARSAAKRRAAQSSATQSSATQSSATQSSATQSSATQTPATQSPAGQVVVLPVALRYLFQGDLAAAVSPVLARIEQRLSWREPELPLPERIKKLGEALLGLKETEYLGSSQQGALFDRVKRLTEHLLTPIEAEYLRGTPEPGVVQRVKKLHTSILPDMIQGELPAAERERRWRQLADLYLAQQLAFYPANYLGTGSNPDRVLETVERLEEDLTDVCQVHPPMKVIATIGEPIVVSPVRERGVEHDPLMTNLETQLRDMLGIDHES